MHLIKIELVGLQATQACMQCLDQVLALQSLGIGRRVHAEPTFGCQNQIIVCCPDWRQPAVGGLPCCKNAGAFYAIPQAFATGKFYSWP